MEQKDFQPGQAGVDMPHPQRLVRQFSKADVHFHHKNYAQQGSNPQELLDAMDFMHMQYTVLSPIPTNLLVQCGSCDAVHHRPKPMTPKQTQSVLKLWNGGVWSTELWTEFNPARGSTSLNIDDVPNYYISDMKIRLAFTVSEQTYNDFIEKDGPLYYNTMVDDQTADAFRALNDDDKRRFDPMVTGLPLGDMRSSELLLDKLRRNKGVFTGLGEITVYKEWVQEKVGVTLQGDMVSRACALFKLMNTCGVIGMPVVLHCDVDVMPWDRLHSRPANFMNICKFLRSDECKNTTIIWAHAGGLGKYSRIRDGHLDRLDGVLADPTMKHVFFDLSWDTVARQLTMDEDEKLPDPDKISQLVALLEKYPTRSLGLSSEQTAVVFGTASTIAANAIVGWTAKTLYGLPMWEFGIHGIAGIAKRAIQETRKCLGLAPDTTLAQTAEIGEGLENPIQPAEGASYSDPEEGLERDANYRLPVISISGSTSSSSDHD